MANYIPTDETARVVAHEYLSRSLRGQFERAPLYLTISEMREDGTYPIILAVHQAEFDILTMLDTPQITGTAWINDNATASIGWDFGTSNVVAFMAEHGAI